MRRIIVVATAIALLAPLGQVRAAEYDWFARLWRRPTDPDVITLEARGCPAA